MVITGTGKSILGLGEERVTPAGNVLAAVTLRTRPSGLVSNVVTVISLLRGLSQKSNQVCPFCLPRRRPDATNLPASC